MSNLYYTSPTDVEAGAKIRSVDMNSIDAATDSAFDKLPTETNLKQGKVNYAVDSGAADAYVVSLPHTPASYADGLHVRFKATNTNTGASTINVNSLGVKSIKKIDGTALSAGDLTANGIYDIYYNSTTGFFYMSASATAGASATAAAASATAASTSASSASTSASSASTSATSASTSATNAATSATTATTQASNASTSATNAATSATAAATSATNAATSETNAAASATAAAASAAAAVNSAAYVDTNPIVKGSVDATKRVRIEVDGLTTATDRVWTAPDKDGTVAMISDLPNVFGTIAVSGQSNVVADSTSDTLTIAAGTGITVTTNATTDTVTIASTISDGAVVLLSTVTANNSATVDVETTFDGTYDKYVLEIVGLVPQTTGTHLSARLKLGGSYVTSNYVFGLLYTASSAAGGAISYDTSTSTAETSVIQVARSISNNAGDNTHIQIHIANPASTSFFKHIHWIGSAMNDGGPTTKFLHGHGGEHATTSAMTGIRFLMSSGNITSGTFRLYGIKNS